MGGRFLGGISNIVALQAEIVALLGEKIWGAFWRLLAQKRALSNS